MILLFTVLATLILCAAAVVPAAALAAVSDAFEPDGSCGIAKPITVDATAQQHTLFPGGDEDWVSFAVIAGQTYAIETASGTPAEDIDTVLYLYDADGTTEIGYDDDGGQGTYSLTEYAADSDTTVYAKVVGYYGNTTGAYALGVSTVTAPVGDAYEPDDSSVAASPIAVDAAAQQHTIHLDDDEDWVSFTVTAGRAYTIQTAEGTPADSMDTVLYLYDSDGMTLIDYNYDDPYSYYPYYSRIDYVADADKTVYAMVRGGDFGRTGAYALSVKLVGDSYEPDGSFGLATPLTVGAAAQQHSIDPDDDEDWVSFTVETGYKYALTTAPGASPDDPNTELYLYDSDGTTLITSNSDDETEDRGYFSRIDYTADADKTVFAKVAGWDTGTYALSVTLVGDSYEPDDSSAVANPIAVGDAAQQHTIDPAGDDDWVSFSVEAGWRYSIETAPGTPPDDPDTVLDLYDSDGTTFIDSNHDYEGNYSQFEYEADQNKTVYAAVAGMDSGGYALSVTRTSIMKIGVVPTAWTSAGSRSRQPAADGLVEARVSVPLRRKRAARRAVLDGRDDAGGTAIPVGRVAPRSRWPPPSAYRARRRGAARLDGLRRPLQAVRRILVGVSLYTGSGGVSADGQSWLGPDRGDGRTAPRRRGK